MKVVLKNRDDVETDPPPITEGDSIKPPLPEENEKSMEGKELQKKPKSVLRKPQSPVLTTSDSIHDDNPTRQQPPGRDCCVIL